MAREKVRRLGQEPAGLVKPSSPETTKIGKSMEEILQEQGFDDDQNLSESPSLEVAPSGDSSTSVEGLDPSQFTIKTIPVDLVDTSPYQPRTNFNADKLTLLADSIQACGLINPILVRPSPTSPGRYQLVGGERRWRAFKLLEREFIVARVKDMTDEDAHVNALTDNEDDPISDFERARAYKRMMDEHPDWTMTFLSRHVGVSKSTITRCLAYFKLPEGVLALLEESPDLIGTRAVPEFAAFDISHEQLVVQGVQSIASGEHKQQEALRWIKRKIAALTNQKPPRSQGGHLVAGGKVLGKMRVSGKRLEITCEDGLSADTLLELVKKLFADQIVETDRPS